MGTFKTMMAAVHSWAGSPPKGDLPMNEIAFLLLSALRDMGSEMLVSSNGVADYKYVATVSTKEGNLSADTQNASGYDLVYWVVGNSYRSVKIVQDLEDLLTEEAQGDYAILFGANFTYTLSWTPQEPMTFWFISKQFTLTFAKIHNSIPLPDLYTDVAVYHASIAALSFLLRPHIKTNWSAFVSRQTPILASLKEKTEHAWRVFLTVESTDKNFTRTEFYDPVMDLYGDHYGDF